MGTSDVLAELPPGRADPSSSLPETSCSGLPPNCPSSQALVPLLLPTVLGTGTANPQETVCSMAMPALHPKPASLLLGVSLGLTQPRVTVPLPGTCISCSEVFLKPLSPAEEMGSTPSLPSLQQFSPKKYPLPAPSSSAP